MNHSIHPYAQRMHSMPESFIREILKIAASPDVISLAGGLPNPALFPTQQLAAAAEKVLTRDGSAALQYGPTEGFLPLRDLLAQRQSNREGVAIKPEEVLILTGSQQGLDLVGKLFCEKGRNILVEDPSYLGAIQAFSAYEPRFNSVRLDEDGADFHDFTRMTRSTQPVFFYCVPNFQNPTGTCYSHERRLRLAESQFGSRMLWVEDNPYGDIFFDEAPGPDFRALMPDKTIHLGSISKIVSPGLRLGWAVAPADIIRKMAIAKQASDLHSNGFAQRIVYQYLIDNPLEDHLTAIRNLYREQAMRMVSLIRKHFPENVRWIDPKGGMFLWLVLPEPISAQQLLAASTRENVVFVPGEYFFCDPSAGSNTMRLNFSNPSPDEMEKGIATLGRIAHQLSATRAVVR